MEEPNSSLMLAAGLLASLNASSSLNIYRKHAANPCCSSTLDKFQQYAATSSIVKLEAPRNWCTNVVESGAILTLWYMSGNPGNILDN
jgi:hypothetical protein